MEFIYFNTFGIYSIFPLQSVSIATSLSPGVVPLLKARMGAWYFEHH